MRLRDGIVNGRPEICDVCNGSGFSHGQSRRCGACQCTGVTKYAMCDRCEPPKEGETPSGWICEKCRHEQRHVCRHCGATLDDIKMILSAELRCCTRAECRGKEHERFEADKESVAQAADRLRAALHAGKPIPMDAYVKVLGHPLDCVVMTAEGTKLVRHQPPAREGGE